MEDYKELVLIMIISWWVIVESILNLCFGDPSSRSMESENYIIKIDLFRDQLNKWFKPQMFDSIQNLATFLFLFYVKFWLIAMLNKRRIHTPVGSGFVETAGLGKN